MNVVYPPSVEQWGEGKTLVEHASRRLEEILGQSLAPRYGYLGTDPSDSRNRLVYRLRLKDFTGEVTANFAPEELRNAAYLHVRFYRLWGDLLQIRNDLVHGQALAISGQITGQIAGTTENE